MFSKELSTVFKAVIPFSNKFKFQYPKTYFKNEFSNIAGSIDLSLFTDDFQEFCIYDLDAFLNVVSLFDENFDFSNTGSKIVLKDDFQSAEYPLTPCDMIDTPDPELFVKVRNAECVGEFKIDKDVLSKFSKSSSAFRTFDSVFISGGKSGIELSLGNNEQFVKTNNRYSINVSDNAVEEFLVSIPLNDFLNLPKTFLHIKVMKSSKTGAIRLLISNTVYEFVFTTVSKSN